MDQSPTKSRSRGSKGDPESEWSAESCKGGIEQSVAVARSRWIAELSAAIDGAQRLAWQLGTAPGASVEARELYAQLEAARLELEALRGVTAQLREELERSLVERLGWTGSPHEPDD